MGYVCLDVETGTLVPEIFLKMFPCKRDRNPQSGDNKSQRLVVAASRLSHFREE